MGGMITHVIEFLSLTHTTGDINAIFPKWSLPSSKHSDISCGEFATKEILDFWYLEIFSVIWNFIPSTFEHNF